MTNLNMRSGPGHGKPAQTHAKAVAVQVMRMTLPGSWPGGQVAHNVYYVKSGQHLQRSGRPPFCSVALVMVGKAHVSSRPTRQIQDLAGIVAGLLGQIRRLLAPDLGQDL